MTVIAIAQAKVAELTGDCDSDDIHGLAGAAQAPVAGTEPDLRLPGDRFDRFGQRGAARQKLGGDPRRQSVGPGALDPRPLHLVCRGRHLGCRSSLGDALLALNVVAFPIAQAIASLLAKTSNFALNNTLTYRDQRLFGMRFFSGLASFYAICGLGSVANVRDLSRCPRLADILMNLGQRDKPPMRVTPSAAFAHHHYTWWLSGFAGAAVGVVWNYAVSSVFTWHRK